MIGDTIRSLRETAGFSQADIARKLSVTRSSVNAWEGGLSAPTAVFIVELSKLFHVSTDFLLGLNNDEAIFVDHLTNEEKQLLYSLIKYFDEKHVD